VGLRVKFKVYALSNGETAEVEKLSQIGISRGLKGESEHNLLGFERISMD
jgi:hypothetical protein